MLSQLQYEMNLDLISLDPDTCKVPLKRADKIRVLRRNTQELETSGALSACRKIKFIGRRKIVEDLKKQRTAVQNILTFATPGEGIKTAATPATTPVAAPETETVTETQDILDPVSNSYLREADPTPNHGENPSEFDIYPGYEGLPYLSKAKVDDTIYYTPPTPYDPPRFSSREMPPGLTLISHGDIVGIPRKAGLFSPIIKAGSFLNQGIFKGPVKFKIFPKPKFTILDPIQADSGAGFRADYPPFLKVRFKDATSGVRTMHGTRSGKFYFEVKVIDLGAYGAIGLDTLNVTMGRGTTSAGGKVAFEFRQSFPDYSQGTNPTYKKIQKGDTMMVAYDADTAKLWYGVNGNWLRRTLEGVANPAKGIGVYTSAEDLKQMAKIVPGTFVRPFVQGREGTQLITNFGDQPWTYGPPDGFSGIKVTELDKKFPNLFDSNTSSASATVSGGEFPGTGAFSTDLFVLNSGGDAILAMSPKSSGRWQFEMSNYSWAERTAMGIAPINFPVDKLLKLGAVGTNSVGVRRQVSFARGGGVVDVNGKSHLIGDQDFNYPLPDTTRFTFDCDFDNKTITIYADGKEILKSSLPDYSGAWAIASTIASTNVYLYTQLPGQEIIPGTEMKYPLPGVKPWGLDDSSCPNCTTPTRTPVDKKIVEEDKVIECAAADYNANGEIHDLASDAPYCTLPVTQASMSGQCSVPPKALGCSQSGKQWLCSYYMDAYDTEDRCNSECTIPGTVVRKECSSAGEWK